MDPVHGFLAEPAKHLAYNVVEAIIAITAGVIAGSVALVSRARA